VQALGIAPDVARAAVREVFADVDERSLLEQVLDRRLRQTALDEAGMRRLHRYLLGQGFSPGLITTALKGRARHAHHDD
jgi:SOS response regulatory protein OraA/RecX